MNPTPKEREAGLRNFRNEMNRRGFLKGTVAAGAVAAGGMGAFYFGYEATLADPVRVGVLGTGDEGGVLLGAINPDYIDVRSFADVRPFNVHRAFHGDHSSGPALEARCGLLTKYGWQNEGQARKHVKVYGRYEELLKNAKKDGVEAVIIALPLHLHAPAAIQAMRLEIPLHVLTEKLMGHSVHQCKEMAQVAKNEKVHLATGHQRHYNILYDDAVDQIKRGLLGDLHYIRAQWHRSNLPGTDSWQQPMPHAAKPDDLQSARLAKDLITLERNLATARSSKDISSLSKQVAQKKAQIADEMLGQKTKDGKKTLAEELGYENTTLQDGTKTYDRPAVEELIRWRLWDRTGAGLMAELGSHQLDAASIFISAMHASVKEKAGKETKGEKVQPLNVMAAANRPVFPVDRDVNDHVYCIVEFPAPGYDPKDPIARRKKITMQYSSVNGNGFGGYGEIVYGTDGTLIIEKEKEAILLLSEKASTVKVAAGPTLDTQASGDAQKEVAAGPVADVSRGYTEEEEHWAWCIRKNPDNSDPDIHPRCYPELAMGDAVIALTANIAAQEGRRINFDPKWFNVDDDATPEGVVPNINREEYNL